MFLPSPWMILFYAFLLNWNYIKDALCTAYKYCLFTFQNRRKIKCGICMCACAASGKPVYRPAPESGAKIRTPGILLIISIIIFPLFFCRLFFKLKLLYKLFVLHSLRPIVIQDCNFAWVLPKIEQCSFACKEKYVNFTCLFDLSVRPVPFCLILIQWCGSGFILVRGVWNKGKCRRAKPTKIFVLFAGNYIL